MLALGPAKHSPATHPPTTGNRGRSNGQGSSSKFIHPQHSNHSTATKPQSTSSTMSGPPIDPRRPSPLPRGPAEGHVPEQRSVPPTHPPVSSKNFFTHPSTHPTHTHSGPPQQPQQPPPPPAPPAGEYQSVGQGWGFIVPEGGEVNLPPTHPPFPIPPTHTHPPTFPLQQAPPMPPTHPPTDSPHGGAWNSSSPVPPQAGGGEEEEEEEETAAGPTSL